MCKHRSYRLVSRSNILSNAWTESLSIIREEVKGLQCQVEELASEKSYVQQKYDELSTAVDARVDQLKVKVSLNISDMCNQMDCHLWIVVHILISWWYWKVNFFFFLNEVKICMRIKSTSLWKSFGSLVYMLVIKVGYEHHISTKAVLGATHHIHFLYTRLLLVNVRKNSRGWRPSCSRGVTWVLRTSRLRATCPIFFIWNRYSLVSMRLQA